MKTGIRQQTKTQDMVSIGVFTAVIAVCSWISIPAAVPFTLQTLGVFTAVGVLGGRKGTLAVITYILLGCMGLPVFSGFTGGIGVLLGTTGGYIAGFLCTALIMWAMEKIWGSGRLALAFSMAAGLLGCYAVGTLWFMKVYARTSGAVGLGTVLSWCVFPFVLPDLAKIAVSVLLTGRIRKAMR